MTKEELKAMLADLEAEKSGEGDAKADAKVEEKSTAEALVEKLGDKIVAALSQKGVAPEEANTIKSELFSYEKGMPAIKFADGRDLKNLEDDEKIVMFFKSMVYRKDNDEANKVFKALVEGTSADGGFLVPAPLAAEVWRILPDMSVMRRLARVMPMNSSTVKLNSLTARPTAYWTDEYASKTTTSAEFSQVTLTAFKLVALLPVSHELLEDANIDLARYIVELFAEAIAVAEDRAFFTGSGTGQPKGISQETLTSKSAGASLDFDDIIDLLHLVPQAVRQSNSAAFVAHKTVIKLLQKVKDNDGDYIWRTGGRMDGQTGRLPDTVYGYPIYEQNDLSENELYFGDWKYYIIGDRRQITVDMTNEGGDAWRRDGTEIKAVERVGGTTVLTKAFAKLTDV